MSEEYKNLRQCFNNIGRDEVARGWRERFSPSGPPTGHNAVPEMSPELLKALGLFMAEYALDAKLGKVRKRLLQALPDLGKSDHAEFLRISGLIEGPIKDCES